MSNQRRGENVNFSLMIMTVALVAVLYLAVQGAGTLAMMLVGGVGIVAAWVLPFFGGGKDDEEPIEFRITAADPDEDGAPSDDVLDEKTNTPSDQER